MEFLSIAKGLKNVDNKTFYLDELSQNVREIIINHFQGCVEIKMEMFQKMLNTEKILSIVSLLSSDDELRAKIIEEIRFYDLVDIFQEINESDDKLKIIKKYEAQLKQIYEINTIISDKYMMIYINYVMQQGYDITQIKRMIKRIKDSYFLFETQFKEKVCDEVHEIEKYEIEMNGKINDFMNESNLIFDENDSESTIYINKLKSNKLIEIVRLGSVQKYNLGEFIDKISKYFLKYKCMNNKKVVSNDLLIESMEIMVKTNDEKLIKYYFYQVLDYLVEDDKYFALLLNNGFIGILNEYIKVLEYYLKDGKIDRMKQTIYEKCNKKVLNNYGKIEKFDKYKEYININEVSKMNDKQMNSLFETIKLSDKIKLIKFVQNTLGFKNYKEILNSLEQIEIVSYKKLEDVVMEKKFIKMCRTGRKILKSSEIKIIMNTIFILNGKKIKEEQESVQEERMFLGDIKIQHCVMKQKVKTTDLKEERKNLSNLVKIMKEQGNDTSKMEMKLKTLDKQLFDYYINLPEEEQYLNNIDELLEYSNTLSGNAKVQILEKVRFYQNLITIKPDIYEQSYDNNEVQATFNFNSEINDLVSQFEGDIAKEEKEETRQNELKEQNEMIKNNIIKTIELFDNTFDTNNKNRIDHMFSFIKGCLGSFIKPEVYRRLMKNKNQSKNIFTHIVNVIKQFVVIYCLNSNDIEYKKIYDFKYTHEKENLKNVLIKSLDKCGDIIGEYDNYYFVNIYEKVVKCEKDDVVKQTCFMNKNVKVIRGVHKGIIGTVYNDKSDFVLMTKDIYGKNEGSRCYNLPTIKINKKYIKLFRQQYTNADSTTIPSDIRRFIKKRVVDLFPLVKSYCFCNYGDVEDFEEVYTISLDLYNNYKNSEITLFNKFENLKDGFKQKKKSLDKLKTTDKKKFIEMKKLLKKDEKMIKKMSKLLSELNINKNTINKNENETLMKEMFEYSVGDDTFELSNTIHKYTEIEVVTKKQQQKVKEENKEKLFFNVNNKVNDIMSSLVF
jgi:hypothetical protein